MFGKQRPPAPPSEPFNPAPVNQAPANQAPANQAPFNPAPFNQAPVNQAPVEPKPSPRDLTQLVVDGESILATIVTAQRNVGLTDRRIFLLENDGDFSVIPNRSVVACEVSDDGDGGFFLKIFFGGSLSRTVGVPTLSQVQLVLSVLA